MEIRRNCLESTRVLSLISTSDDLVVPVDKIAECIEHLNEVSKNTALNCCVWPMLVTATCISRF